VTTPMPSDSLCASVSEAMAQSAERGIEREAKLYVRGRDLHKIIAVWPKELNDVSIAGTRHIVKRLHEVLSAHYALALRKHYSYDVNRHVALAVALNAEKAILAHLIEERTEACLERVG
jgi:hypothetical protein